MTIQEKLTYAIDQFETVNRNGKDILILKETAAEDLRLAVRAAHGDRLPDDWIFEKFLAILQGFSDNDLQSEDDMDNCMSEVIENNVDVYTADLTAWLASHNGNVAYIDTVLENGFDGESGTGLLSAAQCEAITEIANEVRAYLLA